MFNRGKVMRKLLKNDGVTVVPGSYNALTARVIEQAGFKAGYISGYAVSASLLGKPDAGFLTLTEMLFVAGRMASAVKIPLLCDADTGFGNALNAMHAVDGFIRSGVAGVHIEDQLEPKRCGHVAGKQLISKEEAAGKLRAADAVRKELDPDFILIARTDARGAVGGSMDEVIERGKTYIDAGADMFFPDGLLSVEEIARCIKEIDAPFLYNMTGVSPRLSMEQLKDLGVTMVIDPGGSLVSAAMEMWDYMEGLAEKGTDFQIEFARKRKGHALANFHQWIGFPEVRQLEEKYLPGEEVLKKYDQSIGYRPGY